MPSPPPWPSRPRRGAPPPPVPVPPASRRPRLPALAGRLRALASPGLVVAVAYVDPGNFATNAQAGGALGTRLVCVVVAASAAAMLVQYLSAKVGTVTGHSLPELCRERCGFVPRV